MNMMWTILRPFLAPFIISKIVIFKSGSAQLHHFIDANQVFVCSCVRACVCTHFIH
jgi:hypothetical protein